MQLAAGLSRIEPSHEGLNTLGKPRAVFKWVKAGLYPILSHSSCLLRLAPTMFYIFKLYTYMKTAVSLGLERCL